MQNAKQNLILIIVSLLIGVGITYAMTDSPEVRIEKENKTAIKECLNSIDYKSTSNQILRATEICSSLKMKEIINWNKLNNAKATSGSVIPVPPSNKTVSLECEWGERTWKVEWIEFHYTATDESTTLQSIKNSHESKYWSEHIWYHYVIKSDWEITQTRDEKCIAWADKWSKNNYRFIQIAFIGDDKPTWKQSESMMKLSQLILSKYSLIPNNFTISAHREWWPKSAKESFDYWYWWKDWFIKRVREKFTVKIYNQESPELTYMWQAWWDKDFIGTIFQESRMSNTTIGDGGQSIGYCQLHQWYNPWWAYEYQALRTMEQRLNYCHEKYTYASTLPNWVGSRFHGYNARSEHIKNISISK